MSPTFPLFRPLVLLVLAVFFVRSITSPLEGLRHAIVGVAGNNDFTARVDVKGKDEIAQTAGAFNRQIHSGTHRRHRQYFENIRDDRLAPRLARCTGMARTGNTQVPSARGLLRGHVQHGRRSGSLRAWGRRH